MMSNPNEPKSFPDELRTLKDNPDGTATDPSQVKNNPFHEKREFSEAFYQTMTESEAMEALVRQLND